MTITPIQAAVVAAVLGGFALLVAGVALLGSPRAKAVASEPVRKPSPRPLHPPQHTMPTDLIDAIDVPADVRAALGSLPPNRWAHEPSAAERAAGASVREMPPIVHGPNNHEEV